jgi:hypothetical protein
MLRAELDAETAALAPLFGEVDFYVFCFSGQLCNFLYAGDITSTMTRITG